VAGAGIARIFFLGGDKTYHTFSAKKQALNHSNEGGRPTSSLTSELRFEEIRGQEMETVLCDLSVWGNVKVILFHCRNRQLSIIKLANR